MRVQKITIDREIAGILTYPENATSTNIEALPAVLMLHGFGSNKDEIDGFYEKIASALARKNIVSLRVDFRGYGDSAGNTEDFSVQDMVSDAIKAFHHLTTLAVDKNKLGVIGFSLGAAVALMLSQHVIFQSLTLISPALDLTKDFNSFLGEETMSQLAACDDFMEVDMQWRKINISKSFFASLSTCSPNTAATQFNGNLLCIAGERDFSAENARTINNTASSLVKKLEIVSDADHVFDVSGLEAVSKKAAHWMSFFLENNPSKTDSTRSTPELGC